jgi:hypothetical protein
MLTLKTIQNTYYEKIKFNSDDGSRGLIVPGV